jgi:hypothetical protein
MRRLQVTLDELIAEAHRLSAPLHIEDRGTPDPLLPDLGGVPSNRQSLLIQARAHGRRVIELIEDDLPEMAEAETVLCAAALRRVGARR